ncbi:hypothetical protein Ga0080574_TMP1862 [Salipiger abyssi]|uniref:Uncharacterized protein n=1 Tax=Salipiger abyssi TaxID=1250539 RepID=A0A1P8US85_9RHOB|nr:hypothetical protein Ga0080574_TMP1862 [Salipiger abyssi]
MTKPSAAPEAIRRRAAFPAPLRRGGRILPEIVATTLDRRKKRLRLISE